MRRVSALSHLIVFLGAGVSLIAAPKNLHVTIQKVEYVKAGVGFDVEITNTAKTPVFLEEWDRGSRDPHSLFIQQWDDQKGWIFLGPNVDAPPLGVFELAPGQRLFKHLDFTDPYPHPKEVPPVVIPVFGRHRAVVRYFRSEDDWRKFASDLLKRRGRSRRPAAVKPEMAISEPIEMPVPLHQEKQN